MILQLFFWFVFVAAIGGAGWLANDWATSHAVAVSINGKWFVVSTGWKAVGFLDIGFLLVGVAFGVSIGLLIGSEVWSMFSSARDESVEQTRLKLETERKAFEASKIDLERQRWGLGDKIAEVALEARQKAQEEADKYEMSARKADNLAANLKKQLQNSQGKTKRLARKALPIS